MSTEGAGGCRGRTGSRGERAVEGLDGLGEADEAVAAGEAAPVAVAAPVGLERVDLGADRLDLLPPLDELRTTLWSARILNARRQSAGT
jgi:hypothetical protein